MAGKAGMHAVAAREEEKVETLSVIDDLIRVHEYQIRVLRKRRTAIYEFWPA